MGHPSGTTHRIISALSAHPARAHPAWAGGLRVTSGGGRFRGQYLQPPVQTTAAQCGNSVGSTVEDGSVAPHAEGTEQMLRGLTTVTSSPTTSPPPRTGTPS